MTNLNENRDQAALEQRLKALRAELSDGLAKARSRRQWTAIGMILLIVFMVAYLTFIYNQLVKVDAQFMADIAFPHLQHYVDTSRDTLGKQLRDHAPDFFDYVEKSALAAPEMGSTYVRNAILDKTSEILDQAKPQINQAVDDAINQIKTNSQGKGLDAKDQAQLDALVDQMADQFNSDVTKAMDHVYDGYRQQADEILRHLDELAQGKNLDPLQAHQRETIIRFLALAQKWKTEPPALGAPDLTVPGADVSPATTPATDNGGKAPTPAEGGGGQ